jgi:hypothetical protein
MKYSLKESAMSESAVKENELKSTWSERILGLIYYGSVAVIFGCAAWFGVIKPLFL